MSDSVFADTNVLVYAHTDLDVDKQTIAQNLISGQEIVISTQVLQELANTLNRKFKKTWVEVEQVLASAAENCAVFTNSEQTIQHACRIAERYGYSFYDSMIISAAIGSGCIILYSEDLHDGQIVDGILTIRNPFRK